MRGRPLWELLAFGLLWVGLLVPLRAVTGRAPAESQSVAPVASQSVAAWLRLQFSEEPLQFSIWAPDGTLLWSESDPSSFDIEQPVTLVLPGGAAVLQYEFVWAQAGRRAVEVQLALPVGGTRRSTLWVEGSTVSGRVYLQ